MYRWILKTYESKNMFYFHQINKRYIFTFFRIPCYIAVTCCVGSFMVTLRSFNDIHRVTVHIEIFPTCNRKILNGYCKDFY